MVNSQASFYIGFHIFAIIKKSILQLVAFLICSLLVLSAHSQVDPGKGGTPITPNPDNHINLTSEPMPEYPGGEGQLIFDLYKDFEYPAEYAEMNIQGTVFVEFVVQTDGSVSEVKIVREVKGGEKLSDIAVSAVKRLKAFKPAMKDGKPISVKMTLPFKFVLSDSKE